MLLETEERNCFKFLQSSKAAATADTFSWVCKCNTMSNSQTQAHAGVHTRAHTHTHTRQQIIDILASRTHRSLGMLLVLTLVNITFTRTIYVAASVLIWVSCQRAACLVKSGNQNINGMVLGWKWQSQLCRASQRRTEWPFHSVAYRTLKSTFST